MILHDFLGPIVSSQGFADYTELRAQQNRLRLVRLLDGVMVGNTAQTSRGVSARVMKGGAYGFASASGLQPDDVPRLLHEANENARFLNERVQLGRPAFPANAAGHYEHGLDHARAVEQEALATFARDLDAYIQTNCPRLVSRRVVVNCLDMEKLLYVSDGVRSHSLVPRSIVAVVMVVEDDRGEPVELYQTYGSFGAFTDVFPDVAKLYPEMDLLYRQVQEKAAGVYAKAGIQTVILDADLAGILAHEAIGHTVEADLVQSGSVAAHLLNKTVASPIVTMIDYAHTAFGEQCPVPVYVDDEGTPAEDAVLIKDGILTSFMHNKESARTFGHKAQGNARAYAYSDEPLIRMRNTVIVPGKDKLADMIASVEDGYYFVQTGNGQADSTSEFMFGVNFGYEIKNGKIGKALRDTTISGVAFDVLKTVDMLSDDLAWSCSGMCGKKQSIPVGMGGPAIRCRVNVGGK